MKGSLLLIAGLFAMMLMVSLTEGKVHEKTLDQEDKAKENEADVDKNESESQEEEEEEEDGDRPSHSGKTGT